MPDTTQATAIINVVANLLPEILAAVRAHHNATNTFPTEAQILAAVPLDAQRVITKWDVWTASH